MPVDVPAEYLRRGVDVLTKPRGLGGFDNMRDGSSPYSVELTYRALNVPDLETRLEWTRNQAPYAHIARAAETANEVIVFVQVMPEALARYLAERALLQATGETFSTAQGATAKLAQAVIAETVGAGAAWDSMLARLRAETALLNLALHLIQAKAGAGGVGGIVQEALAAAVAPEARARLVETLAGEVDVLGRMLHALETGEYLSRGRRRGP